MKLSLPTGLIAGLMALAVAPAAYAAPANVTVRVEGAGATLIDSVRVTTSDVPIRRAEHDCPGTSAGGALDAASAGNWDAGYFDGIGHFITTIKGEAPQGNDYWSVWVNHRALTVGACAIDVQEGDDVLFFVDRCEYDGNGCANEPVTPLGLTAPSNATQGTSAEVSVVRYDATGDATAVAGAQVRGPGIDVTTDSAGKATVTFAQVGTATLRAEKAGSVRSETRAVAVSAVSAAPRVPAVPDRTPPAATLAGLSDRQVLARGPRELRGSFGADPSGIKAVKLRLTRRVGKRCWYFSGRTERFRGTRCGRGAYFAIGDRADWSYLLPERLGPGRYVLDAVAIDGAGNRTPLARGSTRVVFTVR